MCSNLWLDLERSLISWTNWYNLHCKITNGILVTWVHSIPKMLWVNCFKGECSLDWFPVFYFKEFFSGNVEYFTSFKQDMINSKKIYPFLFQLPIYHVTLLHVIYVNIIYLGSVEVLQWILTTKSCLFDLIRGNVITSIMI